MKFKIVKISRSVVYQEEMDISEAIEQMNLYTERANIEGDYETRFAVEEVQE